MQVTSKELKLLRKTIPFKWRIQSKFPKNNPKKANMIAYVDARDVAEHLDNIVGPENWSDEYYDLNGKIYCRLGIKVGSEWICKSDVGTESQTEKEKGQASDAFKRAAVKWGINRDAYRLGLVQVDLKEYNGKYYPVGSDGKFLKDNLHDYCNQLIDMESLENFNLVDEETEKPLNSIFENENK